MTKLFPTKGEREESCRYCNGNGWFYSMEELGPCYCDEGGERLKERQDKSPTTKDQNNKGEGLS